MAEKPENRSATRQRRQTQKTRQTRLLHHHGGARPHGAVLFPDRDPDHDRLHADIVAFFIDPDQDKSSTAAVGAMNCAGVAPFVIDLWLKGQTIDNVFRILSESTNWLVMLGAAGIGQLIVFAVPPAMAPLTFARTKRGSSYCEAISNKLKRPGVPMCDHQADRENARG